MANIISDETIDYVGILAKLDLSPEEKEAAKKDMGRMLDYIDMLNELDKLFDMLSEIENKLTDLERINSMVIVTCDACENGNDIKYDVSNVMMLIEDQIDMVEETIRSNVSKCNALTRNIQETIKKGDCQYGRTTNI